jgi:hypothetical protein
MPPAPGERIRPTWRTAERRQPRDRSPGRRSSKDRSEPWPSPSGVSHRRGRRRRSGHDRRRPRREGWANFPSRGHRPPGRTAKPRAARRRGRSPPEPEDDALHRRRRTRDARQAERPRRKSRPQSSLSRDPPQYRSLRMDAWKSSLVQTCVDPRNQALYPLELSRTPRAPRYEGCWPVRPLAVVPKHVVHPALLGGWRCRSPRSKEVTG